MERGETSNTKADETNESHTLSSPLSLATLSNIRQRRRGRIVPQRVRCTMHDNTSHGYGWLLPGWVGEERHMESGRVYRYYYDPSGRQYSSQREVLLAWEQSGLIVIDM